MDLRFGLDSQGDMTAVQFPLQHASARCRELVGAARDLPMLEVRTLASLRLQAIEENLFPARVQHPLRLGQVPVDQSAEFCLLPMLADMPVKQVVDELPAGRLHQIVSPEVRGEHVLYEILEQPLARRVR